MQVAIRELSDVELTEVEAVVGAQSFKRAGSYARGGRVLSIRWDGAAETLTGSVVGHGAMYETAAFFASGHDGALEFDDGECTCPIGYNCKHVAAIVIAARGKQTASRPRPAQAPSRRAAVEPQPQPPPAWETPLRALIEAPVRYAADNPLAIELALHPGGPGDRGAPRLLARLMRSGARGGWINGALTWSGLDSWHVHSAEYRPEHLALVRELYAVQRAREARSSYGYHYSAGGDRTLDLGACDSPQLWSLLDEAARVGLAFVHTLPRLGEVPRHEHGELLIDVTRRDDQGSLVDAVLHVDGKPADGLEPMLFLGSSGHGIVCAERTEAPAAEVGLDGRRLRLVRLAKPAAQQLRRMFLDRGRLEIPASELGRFAEELCPALRSVATVVSSDGSFTPPEISAPSLVLRATHGAGHAVELGWEWCYRVGDSERRAPLATNGAGPGFRDLPAERAILADAVLDATSLRRFGLLDAAGRPAGREAVSLAGLDSMRFTTDDLPRLSQREDIAVEVVGQPADYRDIGDLLQIGVSTVEIAGDRDWFDLGVTISADGHELPFAEVFSALAQGESHLLLQDGAHFSLLAPQLQSLRQLIEEARALADSPAAGLRISRYQAGLWAELAALGVVTGQAQAWQRQVGGLLALDTLTEHDPPATMTAQLRSYQRDGFAWLASLWELELGGILADDMGLGKTLQALALICHARERDPQVGPFLVVAPTSVVSNWVQRGGPLRPRAAGRRGHRHAGEVRPRDRRGRRGRRRRGHDLHAVSPGGRRVPLRAVGRPAPRRGAVRQEPSGQDVPLRARAGRAVQARDHRHADGEQPHGAVVAAVDHGARACFPIRRASPSSTRGRSSAAATPSSSPACGAGSSRSSSAARRSSSPPTCPPSRSRRSRWTCIRAIARSTTRTCSASARRSSG